MNDDIVTLKMSPVGPFYTPLDEAAYFWRLDQISCVVKYEGILETLYIDVDRAKIDAEHFQELASLFLRYDVDMTQLDALLLPEVENWFRLFKQA